MNRRSERLLVSAAGAVLIALAVFSPEALPDFFSARPSALAAGIALLVYAIELAVANGCELENQRRRRETRRGNL